MFHLALIPFHGCRWAGMRSPTRLWSIACLPALDCLAGQIRAHLPFLLYLSWIIIIAIAVAYWTTDGRTERRLKQSKERPYLDMRSLGPASYQQIRIIIDMNDMNRTNQSASHRSPIHSTNNGQSPAGERWKHHKSKRAPFLPICIHRIDCTSNIVACVASHLVSIRMPDLSD